VSVSDSSRLAAATWLYEEYSLFYQEFLKILDLAKIAFEKRDFSSSVRVSARRLSLYSASIIDVSERLKQAYPEIHDDEEQWQEVESYYSEMVRGEYAEDIGRAYLHSLRRKIYQGEWRSADYSFAEMISSSNQFLSKVVLSFELSGSLGEDVVGEILRIPDFTRSFSANE